MALSRLIATVLFILMQLMISYMRFYAHNSCFSFSCFAFSKANRLSAVSWLLCIDDHFSVWWLSFTISVVVYRSKIYKCNYKELGDRSIYSSFSRRAMSEWTQSIHILKEEKEIAADAHCTLWMRCASAPIQFIDDHWDFCFCVQCARAMRPYFCPKNEANVCANMKSDRRCAALLYFISPWAVRCDQPQWMTQWREKRH